MQTRPRTDKGDHSLGRKNRFEPARGDIAAADDEDAFAFELPCEEERCRRHGKLKESLDGAWR